MKNFEWCVYTYKHRKAFEYVSRLLIGDGVKLEKMLERARLHDLDKLLMYQYLEWEDCLDYHVHHRAHHLECQCDRSYEDWLEMVIDYECAPYTKPDKPLNAYDFVNKLTGLGYIDIESARVLLDIMHDLGIDSSYDVTKTEQCSIFLDSLGEVTEEDILQESEYYKQMNPAEELEYIRQYIESEGNNDV